MHKVARPRLALRRFSSYSSVVRIRAPEAPMGWPMAMAPPLTLTLLVSQPISLLTAQACAAKASLISSRSRSCGFQPARCSAFCDAGTGPMPMIDGSSATVEALNAGAVDLAKQCFAEGADSVAIKPLRIELVRRKADLLLGRLAEPA